MQNHPGTLDYTIACYRPPVVQELRALFRELPDDDLIAQLDGPIRRGPNGYAPNNLWRSYLAYYYLGLESVSHLIRYLHDNPYVAQACGFESPDRIPSQPTFSRFGTRLSKSGLILTIKNIMRSLTMRLYDAFPNFGKSVAIDSTDIKAWSNGNKKGRKEWRTGRPRKGETRRQGPKFRQVSDPDAGWCVKTN